MIFFRVFSCCIYLWRGLLLALIFMTVVLQNRYFVLPSIYIDYVWPRRLVMTQKLTAKAWKPAKVKTFRKKTPLLTIINALTIDMRASLKIWLKLMKHILHFEPSQITWQDFTMGLSKFNQSRFCAHSKDHKHSDIEIGRKGNGQKLVTTANLSSFHRKR